MGIRMHDCRCSAAINLLAAGVDEGTVLKIGSWKTRAMLDRYNVQHSAIVKATMQKRDVYVAEKLESVGASSTAPEPQSPGRTIAGVFICGRLVKTRWRVSAIG